MNQSAKYKLGSLIAVDEGRKFPVVLRDGPGYTFSRVETIEPGEIGIVLGSSIGHGMIFWILVHIAINKKVGWIPEGVIDYLENENSNIIT
jgi:hypothetical protein